MCSKSVARHTINVLKKNSRKKTKSEVETKICCIHHTSKAVFSSRPFVWLSSGQEKSYKHGFFKPIYERT